MSDDESQEPEPPRTALSWKDEGNEFYKKKDYRAAIDAYSQAIAVDPEDASYYGNRAAAAMMLLQYEQAAEDCERAIQLTPDNPKLYFRKGKALASLAKFAEARAAYNAGLAHDPNNATGISEKAEVEQAAKAMERAKELLKQGSNGNGNGSCGVTPRVAQQANALVDAAMSLASQSLELKMLKMECLMGLGQHEEALALSNGLLRQQAPAQEGALLFWRAKCLYAMGNLDSAAKHLQQCVRADPDNGAYVGLLKKVRLLDGRKKAGDEAFKRGQYEAAAAAWTECLGVDSELKSFNAKLYNNRATAYGKLRRHEEAVADCGRAIALEPGYTKAFRRRAESLYALGGEENLERCVRDWEEVGRLASGSEQEEREAAHKTRQAKVALKRAKRKDFYKILGVQQDATEDEVRRSYKKLALKCHPDRHSSSTEEEKATAEKMFKDVAEAYEVLSDPEKKRRYDAGVDLEDLDNPHAGCRGGHGGMHGGMGGMGGIDPELLFRMFMQQGGGGFGGGMGGGGSFGGGGGRGANPFEGGVRFNI